jgi:CheY-like chemotaxis protein
VHIPVDLIGDPIRLNQVLSNLIANALKFTEKGEISITINKLKESEDSVDLFFGVSDTGIGISQEKLDVIFQPFSQVDNSTTRKYGGTGLGLTIVKSLVELMGGMISVESEAGAGSTFWVTLPYKKQKKAAGSYQTVPDLAGYKVLVVISHFASREFIRKQIKQWKADVDFAITGEDGLELIRRANESKPYHCVIMDYQLPDMNALNLSEVVKNEGLLDPSRFIVITSIQFDDVRKKSVKNGIKHCLLKPIVQASVLLKSILDVLDIQVSEDEKADIETESIRVSQDQQLLIVEDDLVNQQVIVGMLEKLGFSVDIASDGKEALNSCKEKKYSMIFMDCLMPEMDGFEATCEIRNMEKSGEMSGRVPIVAFTAKAMKGDRELCLVAGMDDYLTKPIKLEDLQKITAKYLLPSS